MTIMQKPMKLSLKNCQKFLRYFIYGFIFSVKWDWFMRNVVLENTREIVYLTEMKEQKKKRIGIKTYQMIIKKIHSYSLAHT